MLLRAVGPGLRPFGVQPTLENPRLLLTRDGATLHENDDWSRGVDRFFLEAAARKVGAFPLTVGSLDSALYAQLAPGTYTAVVTGVDGSTGPALLEVYGLFD